MKRMNKKKKKLILIGTAAAAVVFVGIGVWFLAIRPRRGVAMAMGNAEAMSAEAASGSISTTVVGTGTLQSDEANAVQIPEGLTMDEVLVESGDTVEEGDVLATVNAASVLKELSAAQEELADLDGEINDAKGDKESAYVKTYISGRVKKIYAAEGDKVASVMKEQGALLILSIDDLMAVTLENVSGVSTGDEVTVTLSDGTEEEGDVESVSGSTCVVTLTDDGAEFGDTVTVTDGDGNEIGSGELYVHQPIEITGTSGTVADIEVEENEEVSASETLLELEDLPDSAEYQQLLAERAELADKVKVLTQLSADPAVKAEYSGTIQSVNVTAEGSSTGSGTGNSAGSGAAATASAASSDAAFVLTAAGDSETVFQLTGTAKSSEKKTVTSITDLGALFTELSASVASPVTGAVPATEIKETERYTGKIAWTPGDTEFAAKTSYTAVIELTAKEGYQFVLADGTELSYPGAQGTQWEISAQCEQNTLKLTVVFPETAEKETESETQGSSGNTGSGSTDGSGNTGGSAGSSGDAGNGSAGSSGNAGSGSTGSDGNAGNGSAGSSGNAGSGSTVSNGNAGSGSDGNTGSGSEGSGNAGSGSVGSGSAGSSGNAGGSGTGYNGNTAQTPSGSQAGSGAASGGVSGQAGMVSGSISGGSLSGVSTGSVSQTGSSAASDTSSEEASDTGMETAFTISKDENMLLSVNIDELDILSIQEGQKVTVTLDALEGQEFEGEITKINRTASNSGGVTKYTAEVTIPKSESMLAGMNASATIIIESKEDILTLPADAIQEHGDRSFVYTEEGEDGTLSGEVEVETGISDGTNVEITSGLTEGQTVYYHMAASEDSSEEGFGGMMNGGGFPSGGEFPSGGGERPDGGGRGNFEGGGPGGNAPGGQ